MRALSVVAGAAAAAAAVVFLRRRRGGAERVDLYYDDGSVVSLTDEAPEAARILALARDAIGAVRA